MMELRGREIRTSEVEPQTDARTGEKVDYIELKSGQQLYLMCDSPNRPSSKD